jgi:3'-phosphoadenosine 5'-phosphosulfate sulfotransferase (PAPS reductase)/FAD synthetase
MTSATTATTATQDLHAYDIVVISTSGGKDSQAMQTAVVELAAEQGYPLSQVVLAHADLGRAEWEGTTELVEQHARHDGLALHIVSRPQGDLLTQIEQRGMFPSSQQRYCTSDHKRGQLAKVVTQAHREWKAAGNAGTFRVLECHGLRAQESSARAKREAVTPNTRLSTKTREVTTWLPIHAWAVEQVWATIERSGMPHHRAYDLGMPRLSCAFCIFSPKAGLLLAAKHNPELLAEYVRIERKIGHTFTAKLSLAQVQAEAQAGAQVGEVADWTM